jgi:phosphate transport system permease protein
VITVTETVAIQGRTLPRGFAWTTLAASIVASAAVFLALALARVTPDFNVAGAAVVGAILYLVLVGVISRLVEGRRKSVDRVMTGVITATFVIALIPLISLVATTTADGLNRLDMQFFSSSMRNVVGAGGGGLHAIIGTLLVTGAATIISVPVGIMTAIYLVEYGKGRLAKSLTFLIDVMTGIPSIVAGLFAFALFALIFGPGIRFGFGGAVALSLLMIPVVVRSTEEMLKLVPNELREASFALGVPKWLTIVKVVLPTAIAGIITGVMISIARIIGETAPLLIIAGLSTSMNYDLFSERMTTLPVFVYTQYTIQGADAQAYIDRAWTGALVLIIIVLLLNLIARILSRVLAPKGSR